jgi:hypothetical protein
MSHLAVLLARRCLLGGALALALLPAPAGAASLGPLDPYLLLGSEPPWIGAMDGAGYRLSNSSNEGDIIYFVAALPGGRAEEVAVRVSVQGQADAGYSGAGLIFNLDPTAGTYFALALTARGDLAIYGRDTQGVEEVARLPLTGTTAGGSLLLSLRATAKGVEISANGARQGSIDGVELSGQAGIFAIDGGSYRFSDYTVN